MQKLTSIDYRDMPWKNGLGMTTELAISPVGATMTDFDWRISTAQVCSDGAFSLFKGVDRSLLVTSGAGLVLHLNQQVSFTLTTASSAFPFVGEDDIEAQLLDGVVSDFNVMTRRSRWTHVLEKYTLLQEATIESQSDMTLIYHVAGEAILCRDDNGVLMELSHQELLVSREKRLHLTLTKGLGQPVTLYLVYLNSRKAKS